jgi:hypothetical protein
MVMKSSLVDEEVLVVNVVGLHLRNAWALGCRLH